MDFPNIYEIENAWHNMTINFPAVEIKVYTTFIVI